LPGRGLFRIIDTPAFTGKAMKKIAATAVILAAAAAAAALLLKRERRPPDVLLISIDSLRADHLSCYGYGRNTSPHLDELAEEGTLFAACAATTSWTLPSHISIFTGRDISAHQVVGDGFSLNDSVPTLPEALSAAGYATAAFCSSPYLNPAFGFGRGFDLYHNTDFDRHGSRDTILPSERERDAGHGDVTSERIVELAGDWLGEKRDRPFFLFLHFWDVHYDYIPPAPYDRLFDPTTGARSRDGTTSTTRRWRRGWTPATSFISSRSTTARSPGPTAPWANSSGS